MRTAKDDTDNNDHRDRNRNTHSDITPSRPQARRPWTGSTGARRLISAVGDPPLLAFLRDLSTVSFGCAIVRECRNMHHQVT